jgi:hypothetical protein
MAFLFKISNETPDRLVFTDESAVNVLTTYRSMGRAKKGERAEMRSYFQRGDRYGPDFEDSAETANQPF